MEGLGLVSECHNSPPYSGGELERKVEVVRNK